MPASRAVRAFRPTRSRSLPRTRPALDRTRTVASKRAQATGSAASLPLGAQSSHDFAPSAALGNKSAKLGASGKHNSFEQRAGMPVPDEPWPKFLTPAACSRAACRHRDRLAPSALECSPRRMPLRALQQSVFRLAQCSIMKRGLAAYRLPRTCALLARCTGVGRGSGILVPWPKGSKRREVLSGKRRSLRPRPMARSVLAFEGEGVGADEVGFGSALPAGVAGVDCVDLCRSQFGLKTSKVSAMRRGLADFGIAPPMIGAAMPGNRAPPRGAGRCAARKQSTRGYTSNGHCGPVPTSPNQVRSGG